MKLAEWKRTQVARAITIMIITMIISLIRITITNITNHGMHCGFTCGACYDIQGIRWTWTEHNRLG